MPAISIRFSQPILLAIFLGALGLIGPSGCTRSDTTAPLPLPVDNVPQPPTTARAVAPQAAVPYRGSAIFIDRTDALPQYKRCIDQIAAAGLNTVELFVAGHEDNARSAVIFLDYRYTPTPDQLGDLVEHAHARGLRVVVVPFLVIDTPGDKPGPHAESWEKWFDNYRDAVKQFAWISEGHHVDMLAIGYDLVDAEPKRDRWTQLIISVRELYKGPLTYIARGQNYQMVSFWRELDAISVAGFVDAAPAGQVDARCRRMQSELEKFQKENGGTLLLQADLRSGTETGVTQPAEALRSAIEKTWQGQDDFSGCIAGVRDVAPINAPR